MGVVLKHTAVLKYILWLWGSKKKKTQDLFVHSFVECQIMYQKQSAKQKVGSVPTGI